MIDEVEKHILAPVDVVQDDDERAGGGNGLEQPSHRPGDLLDGRHQAAVAEHRLDRAHHVRVQPVLGEPLRRLRAEQLLQHLDDGPVRDPLAVREARPADDGGIVEATQELVGETRLPDARSAEHGEELAGAVGDSLRHRSP